MSSEPAVPKGSLVLVTGANGFIGSHIVDQLLRHGYKVRGTSRSIEKGELMKKYFQDKYGADQYESVVVEDFATDDAFHTVMEGCAGVCHTASDLSFGEDPNKVVTSVVKGAKNVLQAALKHSSIKQVVYTSSSSAMLNPHPDSTFSFGPERWNEEAIAYAWGKATPPDASLMALYVYSTSKAEAERACWDFVKEHKPPFVFNSVNPNFNIGQILHPDQAGSTAGMVKSIYEGNEKVAALVKTVVTGFHIDVKDDARLHVAPFLFPDVQNRRLLGFAEPINFNKLLDTFKKITPDHPLLPRDENSWDDKTKPDASYSVEILKRMGQPGFTSLEDSVRETIGVTS